MADAPDPNSMFPTTTDISKIFNDGQEGQIGDGFFPGEFEDAAEASNNPNSRTAGRSNRVSSVDLSLCAKKAAVVIQEAAMANSASLVDRGLLEEIVQDNKARFAGCITMPLTFIFFALYIAAATLHQDITNVHLLESPLRDHLVPPLQEVLTIKDVWNYMEETFIPTFFRQTDMYGIPSDRKDWSRVFTYNQVKGAVALEQERSIAQPCDHELSEHMVCYPQTKFSEAPFGRKISDLTLNLSVITDFDEGFTVHKTDSGRRLRVMREEISRWLPPKAPADSKFVFYLHPSSSITEIDQRIAYLKERGWLDDQSTRLTIKALVLNAEISPPRIETVKAIFSFSRGGGVFATMRFETLFLRSHSSTTSKVVDVMWVLMLCVMTGYAFFDACIACRRKRCREHMRKLVNVLAWVNVILSWFNILGFIVQDSYREQVNSKLEELDAAADNEELARSLAPEMHKLSDDMVNFAMWYRLLITYMNILLMIRCFLVLEFQPRLAVVIATLKATSIDLAHFLIVFIPTFLAYAIAGMCIFGRRVDAFSSLDRAIGTCFKIAMESEYDWETLSAEDFMTTASWVWTFLLLIVLLLLNMVLAIIMDVYTEVRNAAGNSETVWENIKFIVKRIWLWRDWVSDDQLLAQLEKMPRALTDKEFRQAFPTMTPTQYRRMMNTATSKAQTSMRTGLHDSFLAHMTAAIKVGLDGASQALQKIKKEQKAIKVVGKRSNAMCVEDIMQSIAVQNHWMTSVQTQLDNLRALTRTKDFSHEIEDFDFLDIPEQEEEAMAEC
mmetsp:Transcript_58565/g.110195  ORF Transcript_58565/g.110195 Transcript_58565/m.110195 type:complete len:783 (+) Transcript_58565:142-2490(+)